MSVAEPVTGPKRVVVIGGGIAGLVAARRLRLAGHEVQLLDAGQRMGGILRSVELGGVAIDVGAESYSTRGGHVDALIDDLGLGDLRTNPQPYPSWLVGSGFAAPTPGDSLFGIPAVPLAQDVVRVLGRSGAMRAWLDRVMPVLRTPDESLASLVQRRMGARALERLVRPLTVGVRSVPPEALPAATALPGIRQAMTRAGSLSGAIAQLRSTDPAPLAGLVGGMTTLVDALAARLALQGVELRPGVAATGLSRSDGGWRVESSAGVIGADAVVLATGPEAFSALVAPLVDALPADMPVEEPAIVVALMLDSGALDGAPRGTGVLVADRRDDAPKALTHSTAKWAWLAERLPPHRHVVRLSYRDGPGSDSAFVERAAADAAELFGLSTRLDPVASAVVRWRMPVVRRAGIEREEVFAALPDLAITGSAVAGSGLAATIGHARSAADALAASLGRGVEPDANGTATGNGLDAG